MKQHSASLLTHCGVWGIVALVFIAGCNKASHGADKGVQLSPSSTVTRNQTDTADKQAAGNPQRHRDLKDPGTAERKAPLVVSKWVGPIHSVDLDDPQQRSASSDPLGFLKMCRERYDSTIRDYRCEFHRRESFRSSEAKEEQRIAVKYREKPYSVDMRWLSNADHATRVSYVAGRWERGGRDLALIEPKGVLGILTPGGVKLDIHGSEMRAASSRPIDQFGFKKTLDRIIANCELAAGDARYDLRFLGIGELDNRPCYVIERRLPYSGGGGRFPDRLLVIYIDQEWLVPTGCFSYADDAAELPLGTYVMTNLGLNVGLNDSDF